MPKCDECAFKTMRNGGCPVFNADMSGKDGCPYFQKDLHTCSICGQPIIGQIVLEEDKNEKWHEMCMSCASAECCKTCIHQYCAFRQDSNCPEPLAVMQQIRQGNMVVQQQVINPKRVEATCRQGCPCFNEDGLDDGSFCSREHGCGCDKYYTNWRD